MNLQDFLKPLAVASNFAFSDWVASLLQSRKGLNWECKKENNAESKEVCEIGGRACHNITPFLLGTISFRKI